MLFDGSNMQLVVNKFQNCNAQHSGQSQQYYIRNFKVAKRLDLNYSHHKKEILLCDVIEVLAKLPWELYYGL